MKKLTLIVGVLALVVTSCGDTQKEKPATAPESMVKKEAEAAKPDVPAEEVTVTIKANDQMKYDLTEIKVPVNSKVTLTLVNEGKMPKEAMGHNFVLLKKGTDVADFAMRAIEAGIAKEHIPSGTETIAYTKLTSGGESVTITFDAPAKGSYDFICSFPGHWGMMKGKLVVG